MSTRLRSALMALALGAALASCSPGGDWEAQKAQMSAASSAAAKAHSSRDSKAFVEALIRLERASRQASFSVRERSKSAKSDQEQLALLSEMMEPLSPAMEAAMDEAWMATVQREQPELWKSYQAEQAESRKALK